MNCVFCNNAIISKYYCVYCADYFPDHTISECCSCHETDSRVHGEICCDCNILYPEIVYDNVGLIEFYFDKDLSTLIWNPSTYNLAQYICIYRVYDNAISICNFKIDIINSQPLAIKPKSSEELFSYSRKLLKLTEYL